MMGFWNSSEGSLVKEPKIYLVFLYDNDSNGGILAKIDEYKRIIQEYIQSTYDVLQNLSSLRGMYSDFDQVLPDLDMLKRKIDTQNTAFFTGSNSIINYMKESLEIAMEKDKELNEDLNILNGMDDDVSDESAPITPNGMPDATPLGQKDYSEANEQLNKLASDDTVVEIAPGTIENKTDIGEPPIENKTDIGEPPIENKADIGEPPIENKTDIGEPPIENKTDIGEPPIENKTDIGEPPIDDGVKGDDTNIIGENKVEGVLDDTTNREGIVDSITDPKPIDHISDLIENGEVSKPIISDEPVSNPGVEDIINAPGSDGYIDYNDINSSPIPSYSETVISGTTVPDEMQGLHEYVTTSSYGEETSTISSDNSNDSSSGSTETSESSETTTITTGGE